MPLSINSERLWDRHMALATIGATDKGGVNRPALSDLDGAARRQLATWAREAGLDLQTDAIGNLFMIFPGTEPNLAPVLTGSHADSQPTGGKFDGAYGVLAGLETLCAFRDAGIRTRRSVATVAWTNEEGSRFTPGLMGSGVYVGRLTIPEFEDHTDGKGVTVTTALVDFLATTPDIPEAPFPTPSHYIEAHIEQGPVLEAAGKTIGVVTAIQGARWFRVSLGGEEAHAGTTPRRNRRDPMVSASRILARLLAEADDGEADITRFTVGQIEAFPGSPNTVPGRVVFTIDLRHPEVAALDRYEARIRAAAAELAVPCDVEVSQVFDAPPTRFEPELVDRIRDTVGTLGYSHMDLPSGALHDAANMAKICPSAMIFIPCEKGISHNEAEAATPADVAAGTHVLANALLDLAEPV